MTRRILITGGFGYVGGRVAQALAARQDRHIVLGSRTRKDPPEWLPECSIAAASLDDSESLRRACAGVQAIVHLAAMNEIDCAEDPVGALETNGTGTARLLEAAKAASVEQFVYVSTAHVYGAPLVGRIEEGMCPRPIHPYATSHRAAEDVVLAARDTDALAGLVLRLSNGFGAPAHAGVNRWTLLVNDLCRQAATTGKLVLRSSGLQRRDFITLSDVGRVVEHVLSLAKHETGNGIFNVGGAWGPTVYEVAMLVADRAHAIFGSRPPVLRPEPPPGHPSQALDYRIDKLLETGFALHSDREAEIDATLLLCSRQGRPHVPNS